MTAARSGADILRSRRARAWPVVALCGSLILFDGYDMAMYGSVTPALLAQPDWSLTAQSVGAIGSLNLVGMLIGAVLAGVSSDRFGRRRVLLAVVVWLTVGMTACALAPSVGAFATARSLTGLGMGALFPLVTALVRERAAESGVSRRVTALSAVSLCGVFVGGVLAGLASLALLDGADGWRVMFSLGAGASVLLPVLARCLPESRAWRDTAGSSGRLRVRAMFDRERRRVTAPAWALLFCSLLLSFGMLTWLPAVLARMGLSMSSALGSLAVANLAAVLGGLAAGRLGDRYGLRPTVVGLFGLGAASLLGLGIMTPGAGWTVVLVAFAGIGTLGAQLLATILVGALYPTAHRGAGLGWALGVGRLGAVAAPAIGGALLGSTLAPQTLFLVFTATAVLGMGATLAVPARAIPASPTSAPVPTSARE